MSHVDDGSLHAYLDGALDALPAAEAARIREHLAECDACARRLEEERALRAEAQAILAGADPGPGEMPSLEELRARATARRRPRAVARLRTLTWAASVVLAVGAGWMLRGSQAGRFSEALQPSAAPKEPASAEDAAASAPSRDRAETAPAAAEPRAIEDRATGAGTAQAEPAAAGAGTQAAAADKPADARAGVGRTEEEVSAPPPAPAVTAQQRAAPLPELRREVQAAEDSLRRTLEAGRRVVAGVLADTSPGAERFQAARLRPVAAEARAAAAFDTLVPPGLFRTAPSQAKAAADLMAPSPSLAVTSAEQSFHRPVPGARVLSMTAVEEGFPTGSVRMLQLIEGDTLELVHLPAGAARPDLAEVLPDGRVQVVADAGGHWVVGRARLPRETLETLLARLATGR